VCGGGCGYKLTGEGGGGLRVLGICLLISMFLELRMHEYAISKTFQVLICWAVDNIGLA
jgi:hypothetical protein